MHNPTIINSLEEALRIIWLQNSQVSDLDEKELQDYIFSENDPVVMHEIRKEELLNRLFENVNSPSLGTLIKEIIATGKIADDALAAETKIPLPVLNQLAEDEISPGSIPLLLLRSLLLKISLPFRSAQAAILKTFDLLQRQQFLDLTGKQYQPSFRRGSDKDDKQQGDRAKSSKKNLLESKESLQRYLAKLEELMKEDNEQKQ